MGSRLLVYFGLRDPGRETREPRRRTLGSVAVYSLVWGLAFPLVTGHRRSYPVAVIVATGTMFAVQVVWLAMDAWLRRRAA